MRWLVALLTHSGVENHKSQHGIFTPRVKARVKQYLSARAAKYFKARRRLLPTSLRVPHGVVGDIFMSEDINIEEIGRQKSVNGLDDLRETQIIAEPYECRITYYLPAEAWYL